MYLSAGLLYLLPNELIVKIIQEAGAAAWLGSMNRFEFSYERDMEIDRLRRAACRALMYLAHELDGPFVEVEDGETCVKLGIY